MGTAGTVAAFVAAISALADAGTAAFTSIYLRRRDQESGREERTTEFLQAQLDNLYMPVATGLSITRQLFDRFFASTTSESEKEVIEHAWRFHNSRMLEQLTKYQVYLDPTAPKDDIDDLIEHLVQWDSVYRLKYEVKAYTGPVFAGIGQFGFKSFPQPDRADPPREALNRYFKRRSEELRQDIHSSLAPSPDL